MKILFYLVLCLALSSCTTLSISQVEGIKEGMSKGQVLAFMADPERKTSFNIRNAVIDEWSYVYRRSGFPPQRRVRGWLFFKDDVVIIIGTDKNKHQIEMQLVMESWKGAHSSEVIMSWGPPDKELSDGKTGKILVYTDKGEVTRISGSSAANVFVSNSFGTGTSRDEYVVDKRATYEYLFYSDAEGIVYHTKWRE